MESSLGKISSSAVLGLGVARKTKSLDLQSIYKSKACKQGLPERESFTVQNGGEVKDDSKKKKKRKKSGKEVALVGLEPVAKKSRKSLDEDQVDDVQSRLVSVDSAKSLSGLSHKNGLNGLALTLGGSGNVIRIPRRPRGFVGRRKGEGNGSVKESGPNSTACQGGKLNGELRKIDSSGLSNGEPGSNDKISKLLNGSGGNVGGSKAKRKRNVREVKESRTVGEVKESRTVGEVKEITSVDEVKETENVGEVKESKNDGEVKESRTVAEVRESITVAEVSESKTVAEVKENKNVGEVMETRNGKSSSPQNAKEEDGHHVVNYGNTSSRKRQRKQKKRMDLASGNETALKKVEHSQENSSIAVDDFQDDDDNEEKLEQNAKEEDGHHVVNNGNTSSRKRQRKQKKRMNLAASNETAQKKIEHSQGNSSIAFDDFQDDDDDEEKLEQNAARMLSSRFDPSCTGFTLKGKASGRLSDNAVSFSRSSRRDIVGRRADSVRGSRSKDASRVLRPRKQPKDKSLSRKRRHFYEIVTTDLDAFWFLNRRIKVFWPLDESWYYGLVNDYNPEIKLHHVKYDDRDEEWIDLHNEKFKLLLLPSEVPGRGGERKSPMPENYRDKRKAGSEDDDSYDGSYLDSEPIISWLSRSSRRVKSSPSSHLKEEKTIQLSPSVVPTVLSSRTDDKDGSKDDDDSTLADKSADDERAKNSLLGSPSSSKSKPVVYVRRRLNKRRERLSPSCENNRARIGPRQNFMSSAAVVDNFFFWDEYDASLGCSEFDKLLWSLDDQGLLRLRVPLGESKGFRFNVCLPFLPFPNCSVLADHLGLSLSLLLSNYGTMMTTWPEVALEMLFVDNIVGLRFLLFEGCLKLAVELFSLILTVFNQSPGEWKFVDMKLPITSIRFKLSSTQNLRRQKEFAFYSFSKLKQSKWLYLDSKLQQHCLLSKQLPISECTYDNIKTLEHGSCQLDTPHVGPGFSPFKV